MIPIRATCIGFLIMINTFSLMPTNQTSSISSVTSVNSITFPANINQFVTDNWDESMIIQPILSPDNAETIIADLITSADTSVDLSLQYIRKYDNGDWENDSSPLVQALIDALNRGIQVRIILNNSTDSDLAGLFFSNDTIFSDPASVVYLDLGDASADYNHNKGIIIDEKIVCISSMNWSKKSAQENREAGVVIYNENVTSYYLDVFNDDFDHSGLWTPQITRTSYQSKILKENEIDSLQDHNLTAEMFSGTFNVTAFVAPDCAYDIILNYLDLATESIYVEMYSISMEDIVAKLIDKKSTNPFLDIQIIISDRRVSPWENNYTWESANNLSNAGILVYNSSSDFDYQHSKLWTIDGLYTFIYSGNWAGSSIEGDNREFGVVINDETITEYYENVIKDDIAIAEPYKDAFGVNVRDGMVLTGVESIVLSGDIVTAEFSITGQTYTMNKGLSGFSYSFDTTTIPDGIHTIHFTVTTNVNSTLSKSVTVNVVNSVPWKMLISEIYYHPTGGPDEEFLEIANSFPFDIFISGWTIAEGGGSFTFPKGSTIEEFTTQVIADDETAFAATFGFNPDYQFSMALNDDGDTIYLKDVEGTTRDAVGYESEAIPGQTPHPGANKGKSLQRSPIGADTDNDANDFITDDPHPGNSISPSETTEASAFLWVIALVLLISQVVYRRHTT